LDLKPEVVKYLLILRIIIWVVIQAVLALQLILLLSRHARLKPSRTIAGTTLVKNTRVLWLLVLEAIVVRRGLILMIVRKECIVCVTCKGHAKKLQVREQINVPRLLQQKTAGIMNVIMKTGRVNGNPEFLKILVILKMTFVTLGHILSAGRMGHAKLQWG
jgi:hypothetical protein